MERETSVPDKPNLRGVREGMKGKLSIQIYLYIRSVQLQVEEQLEQQKSL